MCGKRSVLRVRLHPLIGDIHVVLSFGGSGRSLEEAELEQWIEGVGDRCAEMEIKGVVEDVGLCGVDAEEPEDVMSLGHRLVSLLNRPDAR